MVLRSPKLSQSTASRAVLDFASSALRAGNILGARQALQHQITADPMDADALTKLAEIAAAQKSVEEATLHFQRAAAADPSTHRRFALIEHLQRWGNPTVALTEIERLPKSVRNQLQIKELEATVLSNLGFHKRAISLRQEIVSEHPSQPWHWCRLATAFKTVGRAEDAIGALRRAIRTARTYGEPWWHLSNLKSYQFSLGDIAAMREALSRKLSDDDLLHIHFALGKAFEDRGDYDESFDHYAEGNAIRAKTFSEEQTISRFIDDSIACLTPEFFERNRDAGCSEHGPIFVVGLNRSGSTLVEQILAGHPLIEGTGELPVIGNIWGRLERTTGQSGARAVAALAPPQFRLIGEEYLETTRPRRRTDRPLFIDKMPGNWVSLALIRVALPNAKIIDARRHPMACGLSNFKQHYPIGIGYSNSLKTIGTFYRDYCRFMRHFNQVQPGAVHRLINERLIENPEREIRAMLKYLGLPFDPACLESHKNGRSVNTPSSEQVRRPINDEGVHRWRSYESRLGELKETLGPELDHWAD